MPEHGLQRGSAVDPAMRTRLRERFASNLRTLRLSEEVGLSQEQLARRTGLHRTEIGKLEQGRIEPRLTTLIILAQGLGLPVDRLLDGLEIEPATPDPQAQHRART